MFNARYDELFLFKKAIAHQKAIFIQKRPPQRSFLMNIRPTGVEPATTRRRRPVLYPLSYGRIYTVKYKHGKYLYDFLYM